MKIILVATLLLAASSGTTALAGTPCAEEGAAIRLCSALEKALPGTTTPILLSGIVLVGYEQQVFFDPEEPQCAWDLQPSTWIEFAPTAKSAELDKLLSRAGRARITLRGQLFGPPPIDPTVAPALALANRPEGGRYGHLGAFRTKLVVREILEVEAVHKTEVSIWPMIHRPESSVGYPLVTAADLPRYPELARRAGISGDVTLRVVVRDGTLVSAEPTSGTPMLAGAAAATIKGWHFAEGYNAVLTTTLAYRLERRLTGSHLGESVELQLPWLVRITAPSDEW